MADSKLAWYRSIGRISSLFLLIGFLLLFSCSERVDKRVYRIGRDTTWHPLDLYGKERSMLAFTNELLVEIAREGGFRIEFVMAAPRDALGGLDRGLYDAAISPLTPDVITRKRYFFSDSFYYLGPMLVVRKDSDVDFAQEMAGRVLSIKEGDPLLLRAKDFPNIRVKPYRNVVQALNDLEEDRVDGVIADFFEAYSYTRGLYKGDFKVVPPPLSDEALRLLTLKDSQYEGLIERFNKGLAKVKESGRYADLLAKWELVQPLTPEELENATVFRDE